MLKKILLFFLAVAGMIALVFLASYLLLTYAFGGFDKDYSVTELKENFAKNERGIYELKHYFKQISPKDKSIDIEFEDDHTLSRLGIRTADSTRRSLFLKWDLAINSHQMDSTLKTLEWTAETLSTLKDKLDQADCIHIESGEPTRIGFKRSGMGMYFFNVFENPIPDDLKRHYNDSCKYILVHSQLVLEYGGGAIGGQCFYNLE